MLTNSGDAVAILSFLGASDRAFKLVGAKVALAIFVAGIIFVAIAAARTYHRMHGLFEAWKKL